MSAGKVDSGIFIFTVAEYLCKLQEIRTFRWNNGPTWIGLEGHFDKPNIPYMRAAIDTLAAARVPIWLTEVDVRGRPKSGTVLGAGPEGSACSPCGARDSHVHS